MNDKIQKVKQRIADATKKITELYDKEKVWSQKHTAAGNILPPAHYTYISQLSTIISTYNHVLSLIAEVEKQ